MKKVLIDTNILLDYLAEREPFFDDALNLMISCANDEVQGFAAASSLTDLYYLIRKSTGSEEKSRLILEQIFSLVGILDTTAEDCVLALSSPMPDYEDAILAEAALRSGLDFILTGNLKGFASSPVPAMRAGDFMVRHLD